MSEASTELKSPAGRWRRILARTLTVIGVVIALVGILAGFIRIQFFDTDEFRTTSEMIVQNEAIRDSVAAVMVDELYANVDVKAEFEDQLPEDLQALAGPLSLGLRQVIDRAAVALLERPVIQDLWVETTVATQEQLVLVLEGGGDVVSTEEGVVSVDLRELVVGLSEELGLGEEAVDRIPEGAGQVVLVESEELGLIQDVVKTFKTIAFFLWVFALALWGVAIWLARGYRRIEVRAIAVGLLVIGFGILLLRSLTGGYLVNDIVQRDANKPVAEAIWAIATRLLKEAGWTVVIIGAFALLGALLTGPSKWASTAREKAAPYLRRPEIAYGGYAVVVLLMIWWGPTAQWRNWLSALIMIALGAIGLEAVRRVTMHDFPNAGDSAAPPADSPS